MKFTLALAAVVLALPSLALSVGTVNADLAPRQAPGGQGGGRGGERGNDRDTIRGGAGPHGKPHAQPSNRPRKEKRSIVNTVLPLGARDDIARCPSGKLACPVSQIAPEDVTSDTPWECVSYEEDLYSCGGCATLGTGTDCTALTGVNSVSCSAATCSIHSCTSGYSLVNNTCEPAFVAQ